MAGERTALPEDSMSGVLPARPRKRCKRSCSTGSIAERKMTAARNRKSRRTASVETYHSTTSTWPRGIMKPPRKRYAPSLTPSEKRVHFDLPSTSSSSDDSSRPQKKRGRSRTRRRPSSSSRRKHRIHRSINSSSSSSSGRRKRHRSSGRSSNSRAKRRSSSRSSSGSSGRRRHNTKRHRRSSSSGSSSETRQRNLKRH